MDRNFKYANQQTQDDQNASASASARPKIPEKPRSLTHRQDSIPETTNDVTASYGRGGSSLVKVFDTAASDDLYDDLNDEFGFFPKESSDTVTVTIKFSSDEKGIVTETKKGEPTVARPKEIRQRKKSAESNLLVRDTEKKIDNAVAAKSIHENKFINSTPVGSSNDDAAAANVEHVYDRNDDLLPPPIPPPRNKKNNRTQTPVVEDLLGVEVQNVPITRDKSDTADAYPSTVDTKALQYHTPENQYTHKEKEHARNTISKKLKEIVAPKTSTKIVYDRAPMSPVTSTPIEVDRSGVVDQDDGEDFMEYLKGLKADISSSSSESDDNDEHVLYARRHGNIGGSGENGIHLDDVQVPSDNENTIEASEKPLQNTDEVANKEEYDTESKTDLDQQEINDAYHDRDEDNADGNDSKTEDEEDSDNDKNESETENRDDDDDSDESDDEDDDGDDNNDENTEDDTSNDDRDDDDHYFDGQQDDGSDRDGSYNDRSSESSDESDREESLFGFSPGLRSRCNILARDADETKDDQVQISTEMNFLNYKAIQKFCSILVERILDDVFSNLSVTRACSRNVADDKQANKTGHGMDNSIILNSNIVDLQQVGASCGNSIIHTKDTSNGSFDKQAHLEELVENSPAGMKTTNENIEAPDASRNDSDNPRTDSQCSYPVGTNEIAVAGYFNDTIHNTKTEFVKSYQSMPSEEKHLKQTIKDLKENAESSMTINESEDIIDVFPDQSTENEFESAVEDDSESSYAISDSDDYWSASLEHALDSENNFENSFECESSSEYDFEVSAISDGLSGQMHDIFLDDNNMSETADNVSDINTDRNIKHFGYTDDSTSEMDLRREPIINDVTIKVQVDTDIMIDDNKKLQFDDISLPAKENDADNDKDAPNESVGDGNNDKESTISSETKIQENDGRLSGATFVEENSVRGDSLISAGNTSKINDDQRDPIETDVKYENQTISATDQLFDKALNTAFQEVSELIEDMEHGPQSEKNLQTQHEKPEITNENYINGKIKPPKEDNTDTNDRKKIKTTRKDLRTITDHEIPKIRTITYNIPYIITETQTKLTPEQRRQHMMLCKKKFSLLNGRKRNENAQRNKIKRRRMIKYTESRDCGSDNKGEKDIPASQPKTFKVGTGYIILGAGEVLKIPEGQNINVARNGSDCCQGRPCKYFRGLPGVINNAYKMSNIFPKARPPTTAPPNHILHACNRLATPIIPTSTPSPSKERYGIMLEAAASQEASDDDTDLKEILDTARDHLNSSKFDDAEAAFLKLYQQIQEKPEDNGKLLVEALTGLADICIRRSRMCRSNPLEWQWLCMHAIALLQYTVEFCDSELEDEQDNQLSEWLQEQKHTSELKCRPLEDAFVRALYNSLKHNANFFDPFQSFSLPNTPVHSSRKTNLFPLSSNMPQYLVIPGMRYRVTDHGLQKQSADDSNMAVDWLAKFQHYCKDRLQTKDSKECTEKILKSNASKADEDDDDTESVVSQGSQGSLDWDNGDLQGNNNTAKQIPGIDEVQEEVVDEESPVKDYSLAFELASVDSGNESWEFFLDKRQNCDFQTIVQVSGGSEDGQGEKEDENAETTNKETEDARQQEKQTRIVLKDMISPLHEHSISLTLSRSFCRLADKLVQEEEYRKAEAVYDKILDIIDTIQDGTAGMLKFSARIMKNLGTVKSKLGKSSSGLALLNKALQTYRDLQDEEANFEIAIALIELGNGYIVGKNHEDSVFEDVIIAICDFFEKDSGDPQTTSTSTSSTSVMTSSLRSNDEERNVEEAVMCYSEAITLLDTYAADERQNEMFAKAIMRLGDCFFMQHDYDRALDCYEKALGMFRSCNIFGKDSLMENAHVLCMLGVSSFMLHVYPRAASVFETALHMVKCAYGFRRTFLNGMLQSLSGITYYKMKNYHKCVSMCYQSFETYCDIYGEEMTRLNKQKFWLVCQTLYVMGNSYNILSLYQKSIKYLTTARSLMKSSKSRERRQFMRVLQILGDSYFAQYDYKTALTFYNEALEYGECESTISFDEVFDPNLATDEMAIHNRLVSKSAEAHLSMQQYKNAVHYLEQAHDIQEVLGEDIKEDLINTLNQLGEMHSLAGDVDKAIESYKECLEVFREIHEGELGPDMCPTLGNLAAICYVKACLSDEIEEDLHMIQMADQYFKEALKLETDDSVCVKYANFLYSQGHYEDAINGLNNALQFEDHMQMCDIVYTGLEKITLPDLLQDEVDTQEEICLPSACLARYLLILCHKALGQNFEAETNLIGLMEDVIDYDIPLLHSLLGYAMMELSLFEEAALSFYKAFETEEDYILASENYCICTIIILMKTFENAVLNILEYYKPGQKQKRCLN